MKTFVALLLITLLIGVHGTNVQVFNYCGDSYNIIETANNVAPRTACPNLAPGKSCILSYGSKSFNLKTGPGTGKTLAEFTLGAADGNDYYDISRIDGYDVRMLLQKAGCPEAKCWDNTCHGPDAYSYPTDDTATKGCRANGGTFNLYLCPQ